MIQQNTDILLTIAIPTYNRFLYLEELLVELIDQLNIINKTKLIVELLISDNASFDNTNNLLNKYSNITYVKYYRNDINIGAEANYMECIRKAKGEYIWIFGDDELVYKNGVKTVCDILNQKIYDLIIVKDLNYNLKFNESKSFQNFYEMIEYMSYVNPHFILAHSLITCNIFKKKDFKIDIMQKHILTDYSLMYGIYLSFFKNRQQLVNIHIYNNPIIIVRDIRASFAVYPKNLILKQYKYLKFVSNLYDNKKLRRFANKYFLIMLYFQVISSFKIALSRNILIKKMYKKYLSLMFQK